MAGLKDNGAWGVAELGRVHNIQLQLKKWPGSFALKFKTSGLFQMPLVMSAPG